MSLEKDITAIKALLEQEDIFKAASPGNLATRAEQIRAEEEKRRAEELARIEKQRAELAKQHTKEERTRKAHYREWKRKHGPELDLTLDMIPIVRQAEKEYEGVGEDPDICGNHSETDDRGFPKKVSFNIKLHGTSIPDDAREKLDKYNLESRADDYYWEFLADQLRWFVDDELMPSFPFIHEWYQEGRMGGWLVLELDSIGAYPDDIDTYISELESSLENFEEWSVRNLRDVRGQMKDYINQINRRIKDLYKIKDKVSKAVSSTERYISSDKYWNFFFEQCADDIAEQDAEEATEKSEV